MSSRTYLSIGDVLALLRQEFPDVTISKIRFLESQGLVNPERTPSGYRKFYEHDVERLRWVLRQQREHFLPLKVIKGRLEQEVIDDGGDYGHGVDDGGTRASPRPEPVLVGRTTRPGDPPAAGRELPGFEAQSTDTRRRGVDEERGSRARPSARPDLTPSRDVRDVPAAAPAALRTPSTAGRTAGVPAGGTGGSAGSGASRGSGTIGRGSPAGTVGSGPPGAPLAPGPGPGTARGEPRSSGAKPGPATASGPAKGSGAAVTRPSRAAAGPGHAEAQLEAQDMDAQTLSGATMTLDELAQGCGLEVPAVEQLESYGLLCGRVVGGVAYYDEDALTVARVAAGLARYGVEARHLRLHKHAAEREAGFIEQIVLPLLKQRNPEARQRAHEAVAELTILGQGLRDVLLRTTLRDQLGG